MKNMYCLIATIGLCMMFTAPLAFGQDLDGKWFKVTFSAKGYHYTWPDLAVGDKDSTKVVNYYQFVYNDIWSTACPEGYTPQFYPFYEIHVWYPAGAGWEHAISEFVGPGETCFGILCPYYAQTSLDKQFVTIGHGDWLYFQGEGPVGGWADAVTILSVKRRDGAIKSATFNSYGCASEFSTAMGASSGSCTIKGKLIRPEQLPEGLNPAGAGPHFTVVDACVAP